MLKKLIAVIVLVMTLSLAAFSYQTNGSHHQDDHHVPHQMMKRGHHIPPHKEMIGKQENNFSHHNGCH